MSKEPLGRFCWYDLMTANPDRAKSFYTQIAGWGTDVWEGGKEPYLMWTQGGKPLGGVMQLPEELVKANVPPHWLPYIYTPDVASTCEKAEKLGGKIMHEPTDIPKVGQFAVLTDPQGAVFAVFAASEEAPGHDEEASTGEFSWHELPTTDHKAAWKFYTELFDWQKADAMDLGEGNMYQMFHRGAHPLGGMYNKPEEMPGPPGWLLYIKVDDVNESVEEVKKLGGQILNGPMEVPGGDLVAQCIDPEGAAFAIHSSAS